MAILLTSDATASWMGQLCVGEDHDGSPEERALVEMLRSDDAFADLPKHDETDACLDLAVLTEGLDGPASPADLLLLAQRSRTAATPQENLARLHRLDRVGALVGSMRSDTLVDLAGEESCGQLLGEMHVEHEVALARRTSRYSAGRSIENARALATVFPGFAAALRAGEISEAHVSVLVDRSRVVSDPEALAEIGRRALPKARRMTPGELSRELAAIIADVDPDAAARTRRARESRRVWTRPLDDGLSFLGLVHDAATVDAIQAAVTADALGIRTEARGHEAAGSGVARDTLEVDHDWDHASLDALRADALAARVLGSVADDGSVTWDRSEAQVVVEVVIDLDTLRAEAEALETEPAVALVDGAPVPAALARELAQAASWWRRLVTDPVDGHLLDYGSATYLPSRLRRFVLARDRGCRAPGCTDRAASRLQMDHAEPYPEGSSSAENCGAISTPCHHLKTGGYADIVDSRADGSATWVTAWGQRIVIPPRLVLPGRPDPPPPRRDTDPPPDEPPPF